MLPRHLPHARGKGERGKGEKRDDSTPTYLSKYMWMCISRHIYKYPELLEGVQKMIVSPD